MRPRHHHELLRPIKPNGVVAQGPEVAEIAARSTTEIKDRIRRVALYGGEQCRVILADIVVSRTLPEIPCEPIIKRDCRFAGAADSFDMVEGGKGPEAVSIRLV